MARRLPVGLERDLRRRRMLRSSSEPEVQILEELCDPRGVSVDVGAGKGLYALELQRICRHLVCFEPNPILAEELERLLNGTTASVERVALGSHHGTATLSVPEIDGIPRLGWGSLAKDYGEETWGEEGISGVRRLSVEVRRLDDYDLDEVTIMKIDVEGFEAQVLTGAQTLLRRCNPTLIVEIERRHTGMPVASVVDWL